MNQEMMKLYKSEGVSMVPKGCLVALLQIPIFIGLFQGLRSAIELRHASFLWVEDLTGPDRLARLPDLPFLPDWLNLLPILMTVVTIASAIIYRDHFAPAAETRKQKRNLYLMAIAFFVLFYPFPASMVLYWATANVLQVIQQVLKRE